LIFLEFIKEKNIIRVSFLIFDQKIMEQLSERDVRIQKIEKMKKL
jgi:hypothetical protein